MADGRVGQTCEVPTQPMEGNRREQQAWNKVWEVTQVQVAGGTTLSPPRSLPAPLPGSATGRRPGSHTADSPWGLEEFLGGV